MKKNILFKSYLIFNVLLLSYAFNASNAFAEFYVIPSARGVGTAIRSVPYIISSSGLYYLETLQLAMGAVVSTSAAVAHNYGEHRI